MTKEDIIKAHDDYRDAQVYEWELDQKIETLKFQKIDAHNKTLLAKQALCDLKGL